MIEKVYTHFKCSKAIVNSGYRTPAHDITVGGSGSGQHTKGYAADLTFYGSNGSKLDHKQVCCYMQDIGFKGIGYISNTAVHGDMRTSGTWKGDETNGKNVNDFYEYFGIVPNAIEYFPNCSSNQNSYVDGLKEINVDSSFSYRDKIANVNGYPGYTGTATENENQLNKLKNGKLIKP